MVIAENVWLMEASRAEGKLPGFHCYLVCEAGKLTMIDTSLPAPRRAERLLEEIRLLGFRAEDLSQIFLTHTDMDHIGNARTLQEATGCRVYLSAEEEKYLTGEYPRMPRKAKMFEEFSPPETTVYPESIPGFRVIPTPGHTKGHVAILYQECLFAGDCCSTESGKAGPPDPAFTEDVPLSIRSFEKVSRYNFACWCPCHGMPKSHWEL